MVQRYLWRGITLYSIDLYDPPEAHHDIVGVFNIDISTDCNAPLTDAFRGHRHWSITTRASSPDPSLNALLGWPLGVRLT